MCGSPSMVHMRTVNSVATPDRGSGMGHRRAYHAAADGKRRGNKGYRADEASCTLRGLIVCGRRAVRGLAYQLREHAQSGPFAGWPAYWSGGGTVTLDDGSTERIRCRATYAVGDGGNGLNQSLTCASDSYKFDLASQCRRQRRRAVRNLEREPAATSAATLRDAAARQLPGRRQRAGFTANISLTHPRQQAVRRDQGRKPVPRRHDFAVAL